MGLVGKKEKFIRSRGELPFPGPKNRIFAYALRAMTSRRISLVTLPGVRGAEADRG